MTRNYTRVEVNCETGVQTEVPLTDDEIAALEAFEAEAEARKQAEVEALAAKAVARASALAKLAELGLTEEEAAAIAG